MKRMSVTPSLVASFLLLSNLLNPVHASDDKNNDGGTRLFIGQDRTTIKDYIRHVGIVPEGFMVYTSLKYLDGLDKPAFDRGAGIQDAGYLRERYPDAAIQIGLYLVGQMYDVTQGKYDDSIRRLGQWIDQAEVPVYLRIGYEFDFAPNNYEPQTYVKAYKYIVDQLRKMNVGNVYFVWHSCGYLAPNQNIMSWYPGDEYVDWVGLSYFYGYHRNDYEKVAQLSRKLNKPFMIAESSPSEVGVHDGEQSWKKWYAPYFDFIERHDVKIVCYINSHWDKQPMFKSQKWGDARVWANKLIHRRWKKEISSPRFTGVSLDSSDEVY